MTEPAATRAQPYRRQIVGLPLQRSLLRQTARASLTLGLPGLKTEDNFPARLDENGDLFLDRSQVAALTNALLEWFTPERLEQMEKTHAAVCDGSVKLSERAAQVAEELETDAAAQLAGELAEKITLVMTYGILSKFVPDVLLRALAEAGDSEPPPFPEASAGSELLRSTFELFEACASEGYQPDQLRKEWPEVSTQTARLIRDFCRKETGFGPLAWDSPGYEDPGYVVRLLYSAFNEVEPEELRRRLFSAKKSPATHLASGNKQGSALRKTLGFWLNFLERETWYVRRAFYLGMIPLLRQISIGYRRKFPLLEPSDLLFLDSQELVRGDFDSETIESRRRRYMEDKEYRNLHATGELRLTTILQPL